MQVYFCKEIYLYIRKAQLESAFLKDDPGEKRIEKQNFVKKVKHTV